MRVATGNSEERIFPGLGLFVRKSSSALASQAGSAARRGRNQRRAMAILAVLGHGHLAREKAQAKANCAYVCYPLYAPLGEAPRLGVAPIRHSHTPIPTPTAKKIKPMNPATMGPIHNDQNPLISAR
jgi:hypothetical protein